VKYSSCEIMNSEQLILNLPGVTRGGNLDLVIINYARKEKRFAGPAGVKRTGEQIIIVQSSKFKVQSSK
jgi:hypothetical protein